MCKTVYDMLFSDEKKSSIQRYKSYKNLEDTIQR